MIYARVYVWFAGNDTVQHVGDAKTKREEVMMRQAARLASKDKSGKVVSYRTGRDKPVCGVHLG